VAKEFTKLKNPRRRKPRMGFHIPEEKKKLGERRQPVLPEKEIRT
jgi:hypothetical protein